MGLLEGILKNKEEVAIKILELLEGKETKARINLDGLEMRLGNTAMKLAGTVEITFIPYTKSQKKRKK